jgi:protoporphyrinogen oxidase
LAAVRRGIIGSIRVLGTWSPVTVERLNQVGGLSRTISHDKCLYDIGPHRFYTKNQEVRQFYLDILADDVVKVQRLTRILKTVCSTIR